jgi:hypothetical protein
MKITVIKLIVIMFTVLALFSFINAIILANKIQEDPKSYVNARQCGQIRMAHFINSIK